MQFRIEMQKAFREAAMVLSAMLKNSSYDPVMLLSHCRETWGALTGADMNLIAQENWPFDDKDQYNDELNLLALKLLNLPKGFDSQALYLNMRFGDPPSYYSEYLKLLEGVERLEWPSTLDTLAGCRFRFAVYKWCVWWISVQLTSGEKQTLFVPRGELSEEWYEKTTKTAEETIDFICRCNQGRMQKQFALEKISGISKEHWDVETWNQCLSFYFYGRL